MVGTMNIRPYGPGKFNTILDAVVYSVSLEGGPDEEAGSSTDVGLWAGIMRDGKSIYEAADEFSHQVLNLNEEEYLEATAGVIMTEDESGFVDIQYFDTLKELNNTWEALAAYLESEMEA